MTTVQRGVSLHQIGELIGHLGQHLVADLLVCGAVGLK